MSEFPYDSCPIVSELLAYARDASAGSDSRAPSSAVAAHLSECEDCRGAVGRLRAADLEPTFFRTSVGHHQFGTTAQQTETPTEQARQFRLSHGIPDVRLNELDQLLASQRAQLRCMQARLVESFPHAPVVGDIWASHAPWGSGKSDVSALVLVLRTFVDDWTAEPLVDVAPVSDDERLAADWSLVLDTHHSGTGNPIVVHVDIQCTARHGALRRWVGRLPSAGGDDLTSVLHAFERGDPPPADALRVGRLGQVAVRTCREWREFSDHLLDVCATVGIVPDDDAIDDALPNEEGRRATHTTRAPSHAHAERTAAIRPTRDVTDSSNACLARGPGATSMDRGVADPANRHVGQGACVNPSGGTAGTGIVSRFATSTDPAVSGLAPAPMSGLRASPQNIASAHQRSESVQVPGDAAPPNGMVPKHAHAATPFRVEAPVPTSHDAPMVLYLGTGGTCRVLETLGDVFRWYLDQDCAGDLRRWCLLRRRQVTWPGLEPYTRLSAVVVLRPDRLQVTMGQILGAPRRVDVDTLLFAKEAAQRAYGVHELAGERIGCRAARRKL